MRMRRRKCLQLASICALVALATFVVCSLLAVRRLPTLESRDGLPFVAVEEASGGGSLPIDGIFCSVAVARHCRLSFAIVNVSFWLIVAAQNALAAYCNISIADLVADTQFDECAQRTRWMLDGGWRSHACYERAGVDGSECAIVAYMIRRERRCSPSLLARLPPSSASSIGDMEAPPMLSARAPSLDALFSQMRDGAESYAYIRE